MKVGQSPTHRIQPPSVQGSVYAVKNSQNSLDTLFNVNLSDHGSQAINASQVIDDNHREPSDQW